MSEIVSRLCASFPGRDWLVAEQVAACLGWARTRVCHLCAANEFPLPVEVREGKVQVAVHDFARFLDNDSLSVWMSGGGAPGSQVLTSLFQAELRAEIYRLELNRAILSLMGFIDELAVDPETVDERCLFQLEMSKTVLKTQARAVAAGLMALVASTASPEHPLAVVDRAEPG